MPTEKLWRKLKKLEKKLKKHRRRRLRSSSSPDPSIDPPIPPSIEAPDQEIITEDDHTGTQNPMDEDLTDTVLSALGNPSTSEKAYAEDIHPEIIKRIENLLINGMNKDDKEELCRKYLIPKNLLLLDAPKLNAELEGLLSDPIKERDKRVEDRQQQLGIALSAVLTVVDNLLKNNQNIKNIEILTDASRLLSDLHYNDTSTRRKLVSVNLDKNIIKTTDAAKRDSFLFGEKFNENVKSANAIKKAAPTILKKTNIPRKTAQPKQTPYYYYNKNKENFNAPPHSSRAKQGRGGRYQPRSNGRQPQQRISSGKTYRHKPVRQT